MGILASRVKRVQVANKRSKVAIINAVQERRRNSFAYYIKRYVDVNVDLVDLITEIETLDITKRGLEHEKEKKAKLTIKKIPKFTKIGNNILHGNFRELKTQVILHFNVINHRYKDASHLGNTILHFICQEGYIQMLEFLVDSRNHTSIDGNDNNVYNLMMSFTFTLLTLLLYNQSTRLTCYITLTNLFFTVKPPPLTTTVNHILNR